VPCGKEKKEHRGRRGIIGERVAIIRSSDEGREAAVWSLLIFSAARKRKGAGPSTQEKEINPNGVFDLPNIRMGKRKKEVIFSEFRGESIRLLNSSTERGVAV